MADKRLNNLFANTGAINASPLEQNSKKLDNLYGDQYEERKNRGGIAGGVEYVGASLAAGVGGMLEGTYDLIEGMSALIGGNKAYAENLFANNRVGEWHKNIADGYNPNKAMSYVGDTASSLGQSATMLIPVAGPVLFYAGAIGGGIGSAVEKTGELGFKETAYGTTVGVIEGLLETLVGSAGQTLSKVTKGATKSLMTNLTSQIAKDWAASAVWKGVAKDLISNAAGEFFEEAISEAIDPALQRGFGIDKDASTSMKEILYAGFVGFGSGLLMGGASTAISTGTAYRAGKRSIDNGNAELVVRDAHTVIDALKIDENTKGIAPYLAGLKSSLESYELAADKKSDAAAIYLGEVQGYMLAVESTRAVLIEDAKLRAVDENAAKSFAEFMSYADKVGDVSKNYTAEDWYSDKNKIRTRYAAFKWAGAFLGDTVEMAESVAFDEEIRADREGREVGMPLVEDITGKEFTGESDTYYVGANLDAGPAPEGDYLRVIKLQDGTYSIGRGNSSEQVRGYRGLTREAAQAEFERIKGAVTTERANVQQRQNLEAQARASAESNLRRNGVRVEPRVVADNNVGGTEQATGGMYANIPTEQTFENPYTAQQMNAARRAVKNFDMLTSDQKGRILRWIASVDGKGIDRDVVSGIANIIRIRPDLQVMLAETREGVAGFHEVAVAGRNLILIPSGKDVTLLQETTAHELGHEVEGAEGFDELKKAALKATSEEQQKEWRELYKKNNPQMTDPELDAEVAMKALGRRLATPRFIQRYANKSMLGHLIDSCKHMIDKLRADEAGKLEIKTAEKLMRMLDGALVADNVHALEKNGGKKYLFKGYAEDGKGIYEANFPLGTPKKAKGEVILKYIQNVWSKKPINLKLTENGATKTIKAEFDPTYDESRETPSDASKLMGGNRHGTSSEQRVTLDLADDYYQIASESSYNYSKDEEGKESDPHKDVTQWHYFINDIYFAEQGSDELVPFRVTINVKERPDGYFVYSFSAERITDDNLEKAKETSTQRTLHAAVSSGMETTTNGNLFNNSIPQSEEKSTPSAKKTYNLTPEAAERAARDAAEVEQFKNTEDTAEAIRRHQVEMYDREMRAGILEQQAFDRMKQAERVERSAEISRIETMARDYNDKYYKYEDVLRELKQLNSDLGLKLYPLNDAAFLVYQELNMSRRDFAGGDKQYVKELLVGLVNNLMAMSPQNSKGTENVRELKNTLYVALRDVYKNTAKQTPRDAQRERVEKYKEAAREERAKYIRYKDARDIERGAEIYRIETMARDYNDQFWKYEDVHAAVSAFNTAIGLKLPNVNDMAFELYRAFNHISNRLSDSELKSELDTLFDLVADIYEQQTGKSLRPSLTAAAKIQADLRKLYEEKAKQTPRSKQRERAEYAEGQSKLKTLLDRIDRRRETLKKTTGSLANDEWKRLVDAAHRIRPRFELSYDGVYDFIGKFIEFAQHRAESAVLAARAAMAADTEADAEAAARKERAYVEERASGENQLLDFIDPKLMRSMLEIYESMKPQQDENGQEIKRSKLITAEMVSTVSAGIQKMLGMDSRVDKIFRKGRWEHVEKVSAEMLGKYSYAYRGRTAKKETRGTFKKLVMNGVMAAVDPETAVHLVEGVFGDTTLSEGIHAIKMAYELARNDRDKWLKQFDDFQKDKSHKQWRKDWNEGEMTLKWVSYTIDGKAITEDITVTKQEAAQLYMTRKREQARAALALGRIEFPETTGKGGRKLAARKVGVSNETINKMLGMEQQDLNTLMLKMEQAADMAINNLEKQFSAEDMQYIRLIEKFYNNTSKSVKKLCDTDFYGYTNVIEGYYVPIMRGNTTYDIDLIASRIKTANDVAVSGFGFNHSTVKGARSRLVIGSAQAVLERHAQQLSLYKNMTHPLQNIQRLYNYKQATTIDGVVSVREFIKDYAWDGMDAYLSNYFKDVQGMRTSFDTIAQLARWAKSGYAKAVLGLNLASGIKQLSSFLQLPGVADMKAVLGGLSPELIKSSKDDIDKYSKLAENRHSNVEMYYAAGATGKIGKVGDLLMKHLELGDRAATILFWSVAQVQAKLDGKGELGTESNKEYAGKLVNDWILLIQDTSAPTTKSALARHPQELVSAFTMFQSSSMKIFSRAVSAVNDIYLLNKMAHRDDLTGDERKKVEQAQKTAAKAAATLGGTILAAATFESIVGLLRDKIRGNDDEEESDAKRLAVDTLLNVVGTVPIAGGFAESAFSGYDITEFYTDFLNDGLTATRNMAKVTASIAAGEAVESEKILQALKGVTVFSGQLMGIPVNNAMNIVKSTLNATAPRAAYRYEALFYEPAYTADLAKAVKSGKTELAETIYRMAQKDIKTGTAAADVVVGEMVRLYGMDYNVLPRSMPTSYEDAEGNTVKLKAAQVRQFSDIYATADKVAPLVITSPVYAGLSDELKAKALRVSYEIYHSRAKSEVLGSDLSVIAALSYLEAYIDVATLVAESAYIYGIKSADGIKRSELIRSYISGYSPEAQAILLYAAGYRSEQVKELLSEAMASLDEDVQNRVKKTLDF